ncbi:MAG: hypothetical protein C0490_06650 [Marivirga sp.]|nr:hypothetical protein [Marivirga sp.]
MRTKLLLTVCIFTLSISAQAQKADQVINSYVKFIGGEKKWKKIKTIITTGEYDYGGIVFPFTSYSKTPNLYKFIVPFNGKYYAQAFDGTKGWKIDAFKNETAPTLLNGKAALAMANEADVELVSTLIDYAKKGHQAILEGKDSVEGNVCHKIKFIKKDGEVEHYYFNAINSELVMKTAVSKNVELQGALLTIFLSDYRDVNGIKIPFKIISESDGQMILTVTVKNAEVDTPVDDKTFQP